MEKDVRFYVKDGSLLNGVGVNIKFQVDNVLARWVVVEESRREQPSAIIKRGTRDQLARCPTFSIVLKDANRRPELGFTRAL